MTAPEADLSGWSVAPFTGGGYTHLVRYQAGVVAANLTGQRRAADYRAITRTVFTSPEVYGVGTEGTVAAGAELSITGRHRASRGPPTRASTSR